MTFFVDGRQVCALTAPPFECEWDAGAAITAHQVRAVATVKGGARIVQTVRTKSVGYVERVDVDVVQVTVTVTDGHGQFVRGIPQSAFHVFEDGQPQTITHFASEDVPLELIVAIDISGSMAPAMPKLKTAVKEFLGAVPPQDQVTLLGFNDSIFTLTRKTTDPAERIKAVDRLAPWGSTALYDVLLRGVDMLGRQTGRKALVVFTDGEDQGSHATINDVERRLQSSDVTLYMIGQGRGVTMEPLKRIMERLSVPTGGRALFTDSIDELHGAFAELLDELSNQYLLGYQSTNTQARRRVAEDQGRRRRPPRRARAPGLPRAGGEMTIDESQRPRRPQRLRREKIVLAFLLCVSLRVSAVSSRRRSSSSRRRSRAFSRRSRSPRSTSRSSTTGQADHRA